ncbi:MAG: uroporphyrinogen-III C-methyltransferase [Pseudomonadota bacterium]
MSNEQKGQGRGGPSDAGKPPKTQTGSAKAGDSSAPTSSARTSGADKALKAQTAGDPGDLATGAPATGNASSKTGSKTSAKDGGKESARQSTPGAKTESRSKANSDERSSDEQKKTASGASATSTTAKPPLTGGQPKAQSSSDASEKKPESKSADKSESTSGGKSGGESGGESDKEPLKSSSTEPEKPPAAPPPAPPSTPPPAPTQVDNQGQPKTGSNATPIAWLALLLVILLAFFAFNSLMDVQRREGEILQRVQGLEAVSGQDDTTFDQMRDNLTRQIELELEGVKSLAERSAEDQARDISRLERLIDASATSVLQETRNQLAEVQRAQREQQQRLSELGTEDRESWLLAEAQYLLRLANQRLIMTGDTESAEALLRSADSIMRELDDSGLMALRAAIASDTAAVRAVPKLDIQGLYLRLDALIRQTDALVLFNLPERVSEAPPEPAEDWKDRVTQGYELALKKLSEYIVVSRRDAPIEALMDPQYEGLVRQNMRMLLEQAQVAMMSGNELLYRQSLERAQGWVNQFFKSDEQAAVAMNEELTRLRDERVSVTLPDVSASLSAIDDVMRSRMTERN